MNSRRRWRRVLIGAGVVLIGIAGISVYRRMAPAPAVARADPAVMVATALAALERSDVPLTDEQREAVLPLLRVLRDTDPAEVEPSRALARDILAVLSPEQRAEIERLRGEARGRQERRPQEAGRGPAGGGVTTGAAGAQVRRGAIRQRLLGRLISRLETGQ